MFSKILIKLIDQAVVPAILLLVTRVVSMLFFANLFNVSYRVDATGFVFENQSDYIMVNTYSLLTMLVVLAIGILYIIVKSYAFHDTHITPTLTAKLFSLRLSSFIQTSFDIYSQGAVWLSYVFLMFFIISLLSFFGLVYSWLFFVALIISLGSTVAFVFDVEQEMKNENQLVDEILDNEEYVLKFRGKRE